MYAQIFPEMDLQVSLSLYVHNMAEHVKLPDGMNLYTNGVIRRPNLTTVEKDEIRELYCKGQRLLAEYHRHYTIAAIQQEYGRGKNTIWAIVNGLDEFECEGIGK